MFLGMIDVVSDRVYFSIHSFSYYRSLLLFFLLLLFGFFSFFLNLVYFSSHLKIITFLDLSCFLFWSELIWTVRRVLKSQKKQSKSINHYYCCCFLVIYEDNHILEGNKESLQRKIYNKVRRSFLFLRIKKKRKEDDWNQQWYYIKVGSSWFLQQIYNNESNMGERYKCNIQTFHRHICFFFEREDDMINRSSFHSVPFIFSFHFACFLSFFLEISFHLHILLGSSCLYGTYLSQLKNSLSFLHLPLSYVLLPSDWVILNVSSNELKRGLSYYLMRFRWFFLQQIINYR